MTNAIQEMSRWKLEAKLEDNQRYFYYPPDVALLDDGSKAYVIGRKGTGKTAISEHLYRRMGPHAFAAKLSFKNFPFNELYELRNERFTSANQYITLWKYLIYTSVAKTLATNEGIDAAVRSTIDRVYPPLEMRSLAANIRKWTGVDLSLNVLGVEVAGSAKRAREPNELSWIERVDVLEEFLLQHLDSSTYFVLFDELDDDFRPTADYSIPGGYVSLLTGLFKAVQDVRSVFGPPRFRLFPVIFLRDDIYEMVRDPDKTKWNDLKLELYWEHQQIKPLLAYRIARAYDASGVAPPFESAWRSVIAGDLSQTYGLVNSRGFRRPRDYIANLQVSAEIAHQLREERISKDTIVKAGARVGEYLRSEMVDELGGTLPEPRTLLDLLSSTRLRRHEAVFTVESFAELYRGAVAKGEMPDLDPIYVLKTLYHFSVIGNVIGRNEQLFRYKAKDSQLSVRQPLCLHTGLFALNVKVDG